ncbi:MAG: MerR family transcriptional regulator [Hymenobacteraceae bacterium]|nr:MerR family transcriptional regulator [Hymenobacteraceae bacterium]
MAEYQIRELAHLTGVKAHTIRVWEQRYQLLEPKRTPTNIRYYGDDDLCVLLNVALLADHGYRISRIASMTPDQRAREVEQIACQPAPGESVVLQQLVRATLLLDEQSFEQALDSAIKVDGLEKVMLRIIYPFLERIGILWQTGTINPAQEHLITNLIRQKVVVAIDRQRPVVPAPVGARRFILYLPEQELHELALLLMNYLLRERGHRVVYLGQNLPTRDLKAVCELTQPDYLLTVLTVVPERTEVEAYLARLAAEYPTVGVLVYGALVQSEELILPPTARRFRLMTEFIAWLEEIFPSERGS